MKPNKLFKDGIALSLLCAGVALLAPAAFAQEPGDVVLHPKQVGAAIDFGQIKDGQAIGSHTSKDQMLTRTGVYLTSGVTLKERFDVRVTLGGLFWYALPESPTKERLVLFGPGVGQAQGIYSFGEDAANPTAQIAFGLMPIKYNGDATNLGEYLYRSGAYPGSVWTGGWSYLNSASYLAQGARVSWNTLEGKVRHDFTFFLERDINPTNDLSPGYMVTAKPTGFFEAGAGVVWSHALSANSKRLSPKTIFNAYSKNTDMPVQGLSGSCQSSDSTINASCEDQNLVRASQTWADWAACDVNSDGKANDSTGACGNIGYYTFKGFKAMGRVSLDVGKLAGLEQALSSVDVGRMIGLASSAPAPFKVYSEIALLGIEDQPFYYEDKSQRMPIMFGVSLPVAGLLDQLAVEGEYHKSRFSNNVGIAFDSQVPVPLEGETASPYDYLEDHVSDWKWSVYGRRRLTDGVTLHAQAASDHLRLFSIEAKPSSEPVTSKPSEWYYVVRLDFGLF